MITDLIENPNFQKDYDRLVFLQNDESLLEQTKVKKQSFVFADNTPAKYHPQILKKILLDDNLFSNLLAVFKNNDANYITSVIITNGDLKSVFTVTKAEFVRIANNMMRDGLLWDGSNLKKKIETINKLTSTKNLTESQKIFETTIDGKTVKFTYLELTNFLENGFNQTYYSKTNTNFNIAGLNRDEFAYVLKDFIEKTKVFDKYLFSEDSTKFKNDILCDNVANTAHFNKHNKTDDSFISEVIINKKLSDAILSNMPKEYSKLEQAIYIYIKLCQTLTYDPEFFASNQEGRSASIHEDISRISQITPKNPEIVCYEFNQIYGKFLNKIGINYENYTEYENIYGKGHANLQFRIDDYIITADSVTSILQGDLFNAKVNENIVGLKCDNQNKLIQSKFNATLEKVYSHIQLNEYNPYLDKSGFDSWLKMYRSLSTGIYLVDAPQKFDILKRQLKKLPLPKMENFSYLLKLSKTLFGEEFEQSRFNVIIANELTKLDRVKFMPIAVLIYNSDNINSNPSKNTLYTYNHKGELQPIDFKTLQVYFEAGKYDYLKQHNISIPGIPKNGAKKHD